MQSRWTRAKRAVRSAHGRRGLVPRRGRVVSGLTWVAAGLLISTGAIAANGTDLRPVRHNDLVSLLQSEARRNTALADQVATLGHEVDQLSRSTSLDPTTEAELDQLARVTGFTAVRGPAVVVTLTDAPLSVKPAGVADDLLIVHQQDIQAVVNALWAGGAEAMSIQDERVTTRTGIKCVGNSVVLHGVPYAPPYVIAAIGDQARLEAALASSRYLATYRQYVTAYGLGYGQERRDDLTVPALSGSVDTRFAQAAR